MIEITTDCTSGAAVEVTLSAEEEAAHLAGLPPAPRSTEVTKEDFMKRFAGDERMEIRSSEDLTVRDAYDTLMLHPKPMVDLASEKTIGFVTYMETALRADGETPILAASRAAEILDPNASP